MKTKIDTTSAATWADGLIKKGQEVVRDGFGFCHDGEPYDLENFLADTLIGDVPWTEPLRHEVFTNLVAHPEFETTMAEFKEKFGKEYFPLNIVEINERGI